jgi:ParB family transcriptional regulator, chromosome partitioning protein
LRFNRPLEHAAQQLRDDAAEAAERAAEVERLRSEGLPALDPDEAPADLWRVRLNDLRDSEGQPVPEEEWPNVPGAAVVVVQVWEYPETDNEDEDADADADPDAVQVFDAVWVCTRPRGGEPAPQVRQPEPERQPRSRAGRGQPRGPARRASHRHRQQQGLEVRPVD